MCNPMILLAVAAAGAAASTVAKQSAARKVGRARNAAQSEESARQAGFRTQGINSFNETNKPFNRADQDAGIDEATAVRENSLIGNLKALDPSSTPTLGSAPQIVQDNLAKELNRSLGEGKSFATRLARLGAVGENQQSNDFGLLRGAQDLNRIGSFSQGSSAILPLELRRANQAGAKASQFADLFSAISGAASSASSMGVGGAAAGGACFARNSLVEMADGSTKLIQEIEIGDKTKGGEVTGVMVFAGDDNGYNYNGVTVSGSHIVLEDERWVRVDESKRSRALNRPVEAWYVHDNTNHEIHINGETFSDFIQVDTDDPMEMDYWKEVTATLNTRLDAADGERENVA